MDSLNNRETRVLKKSSEMIARRKSFSSISRNENDLIGGRIRNSNSLLSICSNDFDIDLLKEEINKRKQKREEEREKNRKLIKDEIKREKDIIKKMHSKCEVEEKKKIFFNESEFYGVTFEKPEIEEPEDSTKKNKLDNKSKKLAKKLRERQGDIFIEA